MHIHKNAPALIDGRSFRWMCRGLNIEIDHEKLAILLMKLAAPYTLGPVALTTHTKYAAHRAVLARNGFDAITEIDKESDSGALITRIRAIDPRRAGRLIIVAPDAVYVGHLMILHKKGIEIVILAADTKTSKLSYEMRMACANTFRLVDLADHAEELNRDPLAV